MREQNGYKVAAALRARCPELNIFVMSGYDRDEVIASQPAGLDYGFPAKPFSMEELMQALREITESAPRRQL